MTKSNLEFFATFPQERRLDRFDIEKWRPSTEGKRTRWRVCRVLRVPELALPDGFLLCPACGSYLTEFSDLQKALHFQRLESLARKMGITWTSPGSGGPPSASTEASESADRPDRS